MKILIACEESDEVRGRFEKIGLDAWSCDIKPNRNKKAKHLQCDLLEILNNNWDAVIAFPPCTHLAVSGAAWFEQKRKDGRQNEAIEFFLKIANLDIKHIAIENPVGIMSNIYRKPDQIIHPYFFGDPVRKNTCLWLKGLPKLIHNEKINLFENNITHVKPNIVKYGNKTYSGPAAKWYKTAEERSTERSKTYPGIAQAMTDQWGKFLINNKTKQHEQRKQTN